MLSGFTAGHLYVGVTKAGMDILGLAGGFVRGPSDDLTEEEKKDLRDLLEDIGVTARQTVATV
jgi:hypothetical protein